MTPELLKAYRSGQDSAAEQMLADHLPLVRRVVASLAVNLPPQVDREDLVEVGILGLLAAAQKYDPSRGASFATFGYLSVRGAVMDELRRLDVLPRSRRNCVKSYELCRRQLHGELGREPTFLEIQSSLGLEGPELEEVLRARALSEAMGRGIGEASTGISPDSVVSEAQSSPVEEAQMNEAKELLATAIASLPKKEQDVIVLYYQGGLLQREIGLVMDLTESRVSQILQHALLLLNQRLAEV
jgi:RNA polymerase sigma factor for flagellar operon FliA